MKKTLLFIAIITAFSVAGCTSVLNKRVDIKTVKSDKAKIKSEYKDKYTAKELKAFDVAVGEEIFATLVTKSKKDTKTYGELLDTIHAEKLDYDHKMKQYNLLKSQLDKHLKLAVLRKAVVKGDYGIGYEADLEYVISNIGNDDISAYSVTLYSKNLLDKTIVNFPLESTNTLTAQRADTSLKAFSVYDNNEAVEFGNTDISKIKFSYDINKIVLANGTTLNAPIEPIDPLAPMFGSDQ